MTPETAFEPIERVEVTAHPEEWFHLHGKSLSGLRHSHPLKDGEDVDKPWHWHEGEDAPTRLIDGVDRRGYGAAIYPQPGHWAYPEENTR